MDQLKKLLEAGNITQEIYDALNAEYSTLKSQRDEARRESAQRRIKIKEMEDRVSSLKSVATSIGDKFGVDIDEEEGLEKLSETLGKFNPDTKIDESVVRELEAKLKRAEKEAMEAKSHFEKEKTQRMAYLKKNALMETLKDFNLFDERLIANELMHHAEVEEDGSVKFRDKDGVLVDLKEGVTNVVNENIERWGKAHGDHPGAGMSGGVMAALKNSNNADEILKAAGVKK